jgi:DNA polymerase-1
MSFKNVHTEVVTNSARLEEVMKTLRETELVAIDTETDGLSRFRKVIGISFATSSTFGFYIPLYIWNGTELIIPWKNKETVFSLLEQAIYDTPKKWIGHNIQFDDIALHNTFGRWFTKNVFSDTKLLHHTVISEDPPHSLKPLAVKFISKDADQSQKDLEEDVKSKGGKWVKTQKDFYMADPKILGRYAAMDAILTYQLHDKFYPEIVRQGLQDLWFKEVLPLNEVITEFNSTGIKLDLPYFKQLKEDIRINIERLEEEIFELVEKDIADYEYNKVKEELTITAKSQAGKLLLQHSLSIEEESEEKRKLLLEFYRAKNEVKRVFNLDSSDDKAFLLYDVLGLDCDKFTKSGKRAVDKKTLDELLEQENESGNEVIQRLQKRAKERKLLTTYVEAILERNINGYIYPEFDQTGTTSGRFSSRGVLNYQTLPRDDLRIKKGHITEDGQVFVNADFSALEPRCFAYMSSDNGLKEIFWHDLDMYAKIAIDVFRIKGVSAKEGDKNFLKKIMPEKRQLMKQVALAVPYGSGDWKIGQIIGEPTEVAHGIIEDYLSTYPNLRSYMLDSEDEIINDLEVRALTGRKRRSSVIKIIKKYFPETDFRDRGQVRALYRMIQFKPEWLEYVNGLQAMDKPKSDRDFFYMVRNELNNAKNFKIQSLAAAIANASCIQVFNAIKNEKLDAKLVLQVHDEITILSSEKDSKRVASLLKTAMENNWVAKLLDVPMKADPIIATNLGDAK